MDQIEPHLRNLRTKLGEYTPHARGHLISSGYHPSNGPVSATVFTF